MRVLVDIVHPADVLFFLNPVRILQARGDLVCIASRHKDVTCELLDSFGLRHRPLSSATTGALGLAAELVKRDLGMFRLQREFKPHIMIGLGGVSISHAGWVAGRPAISFYAADTANLQTRLTWPFITHLFVPDAYAGRTPQGRTTRFPGVKELSYFHPSGFAADDALARNAGWQEDTPNYFLRTVSWRANHDLGKSGWDLEVLRSLIRHLSARGKIHLSSERPLPEDFSPYLYQGRKEQVHHLIAKCRLYVGESATMAHEACLLGVPAIYDGPDHPGTTRELQAKGLLSALRQPGWSALVSEVDRLLQPAALDMLAKRRRDYLASCGPLSEYIVAALDRFAVCTPND